MTSHLVEITFLREEPEKNQSERKNYKYKVEGKFWFMPGNYFYSIMSASQNIMAFAQENYFRIKVLETTGHEVFVAEDFEKLKDAFLAYPNRRIIYESIVIEHRPDNRYSIN